MLEKAFRRRGVRARRAGFRLSGAVLVAVCALMALVGCASDPVQARSIPTQPSVLPDSVVGPLVAALPQRTVTALPTARLAAGLIPPTNRWFSGLVYGQPASPVYPLPLSFSLTSNGFEFGVPTVTSTASAISGPLSPAVIADLGATSQIVSAYDEASLTIEQLDGTIELGHTVIAEGSPFVTFTAKSDTSITLGQRFAEVTEGVYSRRIDGTRYGFVTTGAATSLGVQLRAGQRITWFAVAQGSTVATFAAAARDPVVRTSADYSVSGTRATTSIYYETESGGPTLVVAMRHQYDAISPPKNCSSAGYPSIFGQLRLCSATALTWSVPVVEPKSSLDLAALTESDRTLLRAQVAVDAESIGAMPDDTYFAGKYLYKLANLYSIAAAVGASTTAASLKSTLVADLDLWTDPNGCLTTDVHCFVYDPRGKGIIGLAPSFGSDVYNDHHFHYGYFLYAAGIVAATDPLLARKWAPVLNLLAADIGTGGSSSYFPRSRVFDAYAGHSWAGGTGISNVGNNQESVSEAVSAWNGLALWASAANQPALRTEAVWMLSSEAASANAYWTNFPLGTAAVSNYKPTIVSQVWGAQRVYSTFFSSDDSAKLAIDLLPMSPVADYLSGDAARIKLNVQGAAPSGFDVPFGDQLLMYSALESPEVAAAGVETARTLPATSIDGGDSRTYLMAWMMVHAGT